MAVRQKTVCGRCAAQQSGKWAKSYYSGWAVLCHARDTGQLPLQQCATLGMVNRGITIFTSLFGFSIFQAKWLFRLPHRRCVFFSLYRPLLITASNYK